MAGSESKRKSVIRMRLTSGGKTNKRLMPFRTKRVKKAVNNPDNIPASKADINRLIEIADWPPAVTRDPNGIRMKQAHNQLASLMNASYDEFNRGFTDALNKLTHYGAAYHRNLLNKLTGNQNIPTQDSLKVQEKPRLPQIKKVVKPRRRAKKKRYDDPDDADDEKESDYWTADEKKRYRISRS